MHAIQRYHYERLQGYLDLLQQESKILELPSDHQFTILEQEKNLTQLYNNYQAALQAIAILIKQYDKEHQSVRRLMFIHKQYRKNSQKNKFVKEIL